MLRLRLKRKAWQAVLDGEITTWMDLDMRGAPTDSLRWRPITSYAANYYRNWFALAGCVFSLLSSLLFLTSSVRSMAEVQSRTAKFNRHALTIPAGEIL